VLGKRFKAPPGLRTTLMSEGGAVGSAFSASAASRSTNKQWPDSKHGKSRTTLASTLSPARCSNLESDRRHLSSVSTCARGGSLAACFCFYAV
jgi:hypothetical protein